jgi:hypothetical protein
MGSMDERVRENYYAGGMTMFRGIALSLLVMCACALLQGATLFAGITNGDFSDDLNGWDYTFDNVILFDGKAALQYSEGQESILSQSHISSSSSGTYYLRFNVQFEYNISETNYFYAALYDSDGNPYGSYNSSYVDLEHGFTTPYFYMMGTDLDEDWNTSSVTVNTVGNPITGLKSISLQIDGPLNDATLKFKWTDYPEEQIRFLAVGLVDNVELTTTVPEPATMTLGLIGMGIVGAARRRKS